METQVTDFGVTIANLQDLPDTVTALDARVVTLEAAQGNQYSRVIRYQSSICVQKVVNSVKFVIHCAAFETESLFSLVIKIFNNKNFSDVQIHRKNA